MTYSYVGNVAYLHVVTADHLHSSESSTCDALFAADDSQPGIISDIQGEILRSLGFRVYGAPIGLFIFIASLVELIYKFEKRFCSSTRTNKMRLKAGKSVVHSASVNISFSYKRACDEVGYKPLYSYASSIKRTKNWFQNYLDKY